MNLMKQEDVPLTEAEIRALIEAVVVGGETGALLDFSFLTKSKNVGIMLENIFISSTGAKELAYNILYLGYKLGRVAAKKEATRDFAELR